MRSPEKLRDDKSVFMNQGEWELLHILSDYKIFSVDNDDYYAEMKFHVSIEMSECGLRCCKSKFCICLCTCKFKLKYA